MILRGNQVKFQRWCLDKYDDPRPVRWLKDRLFQMMEQYYQRHLQVMV